MEKELNLEELYNYIETSKKFENIGMNIPDEVYEQLAGLEEKLIREKVLPVVRDSITPTLRQIRRELILVVEYRPDENITVRLSRDRNLNDLSDATILTPDPIPDIKRRNPQQRTGLRNPNTQLRITTTDGLVFCDEGNATNTFCDVLKHIGLIRVRELKIMVSGNNIVSTSKDPNRKQRQVEDLFVLTNLSTKDKAGLLQEISDKLGLGLTIEII